jgi:pre-mRNA-splicing factor ATP-dependent RNA helicase DHX38/PRP16
MHHLAILLSRFLNTLNPNDQLASTVYSLSKHHATIESFHKAITSFGKFSLAQAQEVYDFCQAQDTLDKAFNNPNGMTVTDHDVLAPDAPVRAGLTTASGANGDKHVFKQPTSRASTLGLDRLAADKRREKEALERSERVKRVKYDEEEDSSSSGFKSEFPFYEIENSR